MSQVQGWSARTVLSADAVSVARARDFVRAELVDHDLPHLVEDVRLVVSELATNATLHAGTPFEVTLGRVDGVVRVVVEDGSPVAPAHPVRVSSSDIGGRGLQIVAALSSGWGVDHRRDGSKSVWATFATHGP